MTAATTTGTIQADQAIFTSIRSPMGEGYRIVVASKGVTPDEKREILKYAPSHGSLSHDSPDARALAYFPLSTGRRCIFLTRAAGLEHTGRGGYRVFTHILVLEPTGMRAFAWDPFSIAATIQEYSDEEVRRPPDSMTPKPLTPAKNSGASDAIMETLVPAPADSEMTLHIAARLLAEGGLFVVGASNAATILHTVWEVLPAYVRQGISFSCGLKYSPTRSFDVVFTEASTPELIKIERERSSGVYSWGTALTPVTTAYPKWLKLVADRWVENRMGDIRNVCDGLVSECHPVVLEKIAELLQDLDIVPIANSTTLSQLEQRHSGEECSIGVWGELLKCFSLAVRARQLELDSRRQSDAQELSPKI